MLAFLCGGMEYAPDGGREWRERIRLWLQENLNHHVYDPTLEARRILSPEELSNLPNWKTTDLDRFRKVMRFVLNQDLDVMARRADYVICYWDEAAARGGGTQAELTGAYRKGIPVYLVTEIPVEDISGWVLGCTDRIFPSFESLKSFLVVTYGKEARQQALWQAR
jgi:hypothetical protein